MKIFGKVVVTFIFALIVVGLAGTVQSKADTVTLEKRNSSMWLATGKNYVFKLSDDISGKGFVWSSSKPKVINIDRKTGKVLSLKKGKCVVSAKKGKKEYSIKITVSKDELTRLLSTSREVKSWMLNQKDTIHTTYGDLIYTEKSKIQGAFPLKIRHWSLFEFMYSPDGKCTTSIVCTVDSIILRYSQPQGTRTIKGEQIFGFDELSADSDIDLNWEYLGGYSATELNNKVAKNVKTLVKNLMDWSDKNGFNYTTWDYTLGEF